MALTLLLILVLASGLQSQRYNHITGPEKLYGTVGGSVFAQYQYTKEFQSNIKYWCKFEYNPYYKCINVVDTRGQTGESYKGRAQIIDDKDNLTITVILQQLNEQDEGIYKCAISTGNYHQYSGRPLLKEKAHVFHQRLGSNEPFVASKGWLNWFKQHHGIRQLRLCREQLSAAANGVAPFIDQLLQTIENEGFVMEQLFSSPNRARDSNRCAGKIS
nr:PREDICTED: CMRF35-like molecule 2 [Latimeria chalumnae]|eukprot:XP_014341418.1 PREDICTED: CMRF35-like molecule 2 [Latimeria chalumnae]